MTVPIIITEATGNHQTETYPVGTTIWYLHPKRNVYQLQMIQYTGYRNYNTGFEIVHTTFWQHLHTGTFHVSIVVPLLASHGDGQPRTPAGGPRTLTRKRLRELLRTTYQQGIQDSAVIQPDITDSDIDQLISNFSENS